MSLPFKKITVYSILVGIVVAVLAAARNASLPTIVTYAGYTAAVSLVLQVAVASVVRYFVSKKKEKH